MLSLPLSVAALLLVAEPAPDVTKPADAKSLATALGHTVGAAMECAMGERADDALARAEQAVSQAASTEDADEIEMDDRFHDAVAEGRDAVLDGTTTCGDAEQALQRLEGKAPD